MTHVVELLGGSHVFVGKIITNDLDLVHAAERGFPTGAVDAVVRGGILDAGEVDRLLIPLEELDDRTRRGQSLTPDESDRLARIARIALLALETFGHRHRAHRWMRKPNRGLGGAIPLDLLATGEGGRIVEDALVQLGHGVFA